MITQRRTYGTNRFTAMWAYLGLLGGFISLLALAAAPFFGKTLFDQPKAVEVEETLVLTEFTLKPRLIGALRVDAKAIIPADHWVVYEVKLVDEQGNILVSAIKEAWAEAGTWEEEGESGKWQEQDLIAGLDVKGRKTQKVKLLLTVIGYGTGETDLNDLVSFDILVKDGVIDTRHLWPGLMGSSILGILGLMAVPLCGQRVITRTVPDSDLTARETVGGPDKLVRVNVTIKTDETSPPSLNMELIINNAHGERMYRTSQQIKMTITKNEGKITGANGHFQAFFIIEPQASYGFHIEVTPDASVDQTTLKVQEGTRTRQGVSVTHLS